MLLILASTFHMIFRITKELFEIALERALNNEFCMKRKIRL